MTRPGRPLRAGLLVGLVFLVACSSSSGPSGADRRPAPPAPPPPAPTAPESRTHPDREAPRPARADPIPDGVATLDGRAIHYVARGWSNAEHPRQAVVLVHGWASNASAWDEQVEVIGAHARVIAINLPGHDGSELPAREFSMDLFADAIATVMDDAGIDSGVLVGHSNGTPTIRQFYREYPGRTRALVIVDGALKSFFSPDAARPFLDQLRSPDYRSFVTSMVQGMLSASTRMSDDERRRIEEMALATPQEAMIGAMEAGVDPAIWTDDPINVPTLVVLAKAPFWTDEYEAFVRELVPDVEYHTLEGVSHFLMVDDPQTFNTLLLDFLRRIDFIR